MIITSLKTYPIKSAMGITLSSSEVLDTGLLHDRKWALFTEEGKVITAREFPQLLKLKVSIAEGKLIVASGQSSLQLPLTSHSSEEFDLKVFSEPVKGIEIKSDASNWFSDLLGARCRLMTMPDDPRRPVLQKYGGKSQDRVYYADECPILLTSESSLGHLNQKLKYPVSMDRFRPNIVVKGFEANQEFDWKFIRIGDCEFEVAQLCKRCVMIAIDPATGEKDPQQEPLRTLADYSKHPKGGVAFGVHLIPRTTGVISLDDQVSILQ